jgi:hypothetical protein
MGIDKAHQDGMVDAAPSIQRKPRGTAQQMRRPAGFNGME